jgi:DNA-binding SARP family transcriptional activator/tetratricopeptide (TPR) repeat protein
MNERTADPAAVLRLLGALRLRRAGQEIELPAHLPGALLLRLALAGDWMARDAVTVLFWPDAPRAVAQHNLRVQLHRLRLWLAAQGLGSALQVERVRLRLGLDSDVAHLRRALRAQDWEAVLQACGGTLAPSLALRGAFAAFDDWLIGEREALASARHHALCERARSLAERQRRDDARNLLLGHLHEDDPAEDLLQTLLELCDDADAAQVQRALDLVDRFQRRSEQRHGVPALPRTLALAAALRRRSGADVADVDPTGPALPAPAAAMHEPQWLPRGDLLARLNPLADRWQLVAGEPGAGKTRLLREAVAGLAGVWLACRESERDDALAPLRRWWHRVAPTLTGNPWWAEHGQTLGAELGRRWSDTGALDGADFPADDPESADATGSGSDQERGTRSAARARGGVRTLRWQRTLQRAAVALLALAQRLQQPLVVDDLQWADAATLELLRAMARAQAAGPVGAGPAVWLAVRPDEAEPALLRWLWARRTEGALDWHDLSGLSAHELEAWVAGDADAARRLHRLSGGNPFFAWHLLSWHGAVGLRRGADDVDNDADVRARPPVDLPQEVRRLVRHRVALLDASAQRVLAVAAVAGDARHLEALATVASVQPWTLASGLAAAERSGLLRGREFVHDIVREAIAAELPTAQRTVLHAGIARRMAALWPPQRVAPHAWAGGAAEAAIRAVRSADDADRQRGAHHSAAERARRWLERLRSGGGPEAAPLAEADRAELQAALCCDLARTDFELGALDRCREQLAEVLAGLASPELRVEAWILQAEIALHEGSHSAADAALAQAQALQRPTPALWRMLATVAHSRGDYTAAEAAFERLVRQLRRQAPGAALVQALTSLGAARDRARGPGAGMRLHEEAWTLAARLGARHLQVVVAMNLVEALLQQHRVDDALRWAEAALELGEYEATPSLVNNFSAALLRAGRLPDARRWSLRLEHHPRPTLRCLARARLLRIAAAQGERSEVAERVPGLLEAMAATDDYLAQAAGVATLLDHADAEHHTAALRFVKPQPLHAQMQTWLELALARRGHRQRPAVDLPTP